MACLLLVAFALLGWGLTAPRALAETYRWVDAEGRVGFGDQPPPGARQVRVIGGDTGKDAVQIVPGLEAANAPPAARQPETDAARRLRQLEEQERKSIGGRSEGEWRKRALALERRVESLRESLAHAEDQLSSAYALGRSAYYQRRVDRLRVQLEAAERQLGDFEDRARELGVPPGWLR